jgi:hypothetical protein
VEEGAGLVGATAISWGKGNIDQVSCTSCSNLFDVLLQITEGAVRAYQLSSPQVLVGLQRRAEENVLGFLGANNTAKEHRWIGIPRY